MYEFSLERQDQTRAVKKSKIRMSREWKLLIMAKGDGDDQGWQPDMCEPGNHMYDSAGQNLEKLI